MFQRFLGAVLVGALLLATVARADLPPDPTVEPPNLTQHKWQLRAYLDSGGYAKGVADVSLQAIKYLEKRAPRGAKGRPLAIVFDIDETALSNLTELLGNDFGYNPRIWDAWVASAQCPAIIPVQTIYDTAVKLKVEVIFITGRPESQRAVTERNLRDVGYATWSKLYFKPPGDPTLTDAGFKTDVRRKLTQAGYVIIANVGDQNCDLVNGYAERTFKLPNPFYYSQ